MMGPRRQWPAAVIVTKIQATHFFALEKISAGSTRSPSRYSLLFHFRIFHRPPGRTYQRLVVRWPSDGGRLEARRKEPAISLGRRGRIISPSSPSFGHDTKLTHWQVTPGQKKEKTVPCASGCLALVRTSFSRDGQLLRLRTAPTESNTHTHWNQRSFNHQTTAEDFCLVWRTMTSFVC